MNLPPAQREAFHPNFELVCNDEERMQGIPALLVMSRESRSWVWSHYHRYCPDFTINVKHSIFSFTPWEGYPFKDSDPTAWLKEINDTALNQALSLASNGARLILPPAQEHHKIARAISIRRLSTLPYLRGPIDELITPYSLRLLQEAQQLSSDLTTPHTISTPPVRRRRLLHNC